MSDLLYRFHQEVATAAVGHLPAQWDLLEKFQQEIAAWRDPNQLPDRNLFADPGSPAPAKANSDDGYASLIVETFQAFDIPVEVIASEIGPRVTQYYLRPKSLNGRRAKISAIKARNEDLALALGKRTAITNSPRKAHFGDSERRV